MLLPSGSMGSMIGMTLGIGRNICLWGPIWTLRDYSKLKIFEIQQMQKEAFLELPLFH